MGIGDNATFDGSYIFGDINEMNTVDDDREVQVNQYFGLTGNETINGGGRGRRTHVSGRLIADNLSDLQSLESNFRSYRDGHNYSLVECDGTEWSQVQLHSFNPSGPRYQDGITGQCFRRYTATFWHAV